MPNIFENKPKRSDSNSKEDLLKTKNTQIILLEEKIKSLREEWEQAPNLEDTLNDDWEEDEDVRIKKDVEKEIIILKKRLADIKNGISIIENHHDKILYPSDPKLN